MWPPKDFRPSGHLLARLARVNRRPARHRSRWHARSRPIMDPATLGSKFAQHDLCTSTERIIQPTSWSWYPPVTKSNPSPAGLYCACTYSYSSRSGCLCQSHIPRRDELGRGRSGLGGCHVEWAFQTTELLCHSNGKTLLSTLHHELSTVKASRLRKHQTRLGDFFGSQNWWIQIPCRVVALAVMGHLDLRMCASHRQPPTVQS